MTESEEVKYWHNFIDGDLNALSCLFSYYVRNLVSYGMKICRDEELVRDSIQEVFIRLIQKRHKLKRNENIKGLVFKMLRNQIFDEIKLITKSQKTNKLIFTSGNTFEMDSEYLQIAREDEKKRESLITLALDQLSAHQKEAMILKYSNDFSYEQISQVMGIGVASARTLIYRTLKQMKQTMTGE